MMENAEAIRRIQEHMRVHKMGQYPHELIKVALDKSINALREQEERRWIPVTERFPEIGQKCLIANREIVVRGWLRPDGVWKTGVSSDDTWSKFSLYPPTYWMPLPELPKKELLNALDGAKKPQTNADRIRSMADQELAVFEGACTETLCEDAMMKWLQQPAEGE